MVVAFRRHTLLPPDDCLFTLQPSVSHLTRSALHRCLQRHGIPGCRTSRATSRSASASSATPSVSSTWIIAEVQTAEGTLYLFVGIDRTSKFAVAQLGEG